MSQHTDAQEQRVSALEAFREAQQGIIRFLIPWSRHLDESWILHLMDIGRIDRDGCGFFVPAKDDLIDASQPASAAPHKDSGSEI